MISPADYIELPTKKQNMRSDSSKRLLHKYLPLLNELGSDVNIVTFSKFINGVSSEASTKSTIAHSILPYLVTSGVITKDAAITFGALFPQPIKDWSSANITVDDINGLLHYIKRRFRGDFLQKRNRAIVSMLATFGMRASQLSDLKLSDYSKDGEHIKLNLLKQKHNKHTGGLHHVVYFKRNHLIGGISIESSMDDYLSVHKDSEWLFTNNSGVKMTYNTVGKMFKTLSSEVDGITAHKLRHYVGSYLTESYGIAYANAMLGHSNFEVTRKYINKENLLKTQGVQHGTTSSIVV